MQAQLAEFDEGSPGPSCKRAPSPPAEQAASSWLRRTLQSLRASPSLRLVFREPAPVSVLAVQRYLGEETRAPYYYDITLWDGMERDTWMLSPELSHLVHSNRLHCGSRAALTRCSYRYQEKRLASGLVCVEELQLVADGTGEDHSQDSPGPELPLCGDRKHYLPLWNNDDPYGEIWAQRTPAEDVSVDVLELLDIIVGSLTIRGGDRTGGYIIVHQGLINAFGVSKVCSLQNLDMRWQAKITLPPLLVRIMHKSRLRYFGKADKKMDFPYQAYFEVADHSGRMSLVLWNSLCPEWYNTLQIGKVILLQQYVLKKSYPNRTLPTSENTQVKRLPSLEISLNARDPPSKISFLQEKHVKPEWKLPAVKYQFMTRLDFNDLPHNKVCDVIGLVTYVGRSERKRIRDDSEDFWLYRWVHMIDGTSEQPFLLEIFATSQPDIFENIHPMSYLVCTQMRVVREYPEDTSYKAYLTTSNESQVYISGYHKGQLYTSDEKVKAFINWMKTQNESDVKRKVTIGGYHPYPQTPATFTKYCNDTKEKILTTIHELKTIIEQLHYRERRRVAVQGIIAACRFVENITSDTSEVEHFHETENMVPVPTCTVPQFGTREPIAEILTLGGQQRDHPVGINHSGNLLQHCTEELTPQGETNNVSLVKRRKKQREPILNELASESHPSMPHSACDLDTSSQESLFSEEKDAGSYVAESDKSDRTPSLGSSWENDLWSEVKHAITECLHYSSIFPESLPQKFNYNQKEILMQQYNLHPAKIIKSKIYGCKRKIPDYASVCGLGHYEFTILGINQNIAIDVSLPVFDHLSLFGTNCPPSLLQSAGTSVTAENRDHHWVTLRDDLVEYAKARDRLHLVCILDICHLGESKVEVCLNRVYPVTDCAADA
ncbi:RPA-related protein RADX isoform X2 [Pseudophryne corroboree]|uniref:RPA-related protein RADX isoform X2 n=1 Tax=Pseudophryne corroboree TaxID=495146 RepID=UPI003081AEDD